MSPLQKVVFLPHAVSPVWAASAPLWAPCLLPTCTSTPSLSTTKYPMTSMRGPLATPLFPRPAEWPVPTSAAWGPSPSWSLPRTGMGPLCKAELRSVSAHFDCHYSILLFYRNLWRSKWRSLQRDQSELKSDEIKFDFQNFNKHSQKNFIQQDAQRWLICLLLFCK